MSCFSVNFIQLLMLMLRKWNALFWGVCIQAHIISNTRFYLHKSSPKRLIKKQFQPLEYACQLKYIQWTAIDIELDDDADDDDGALRMMMLSVSMVRQKRVFIPSIDWLYGWKGLHKGCFVSCLAGTSTNYSTWELCQLLFIIFIRNSSQSGHNKRATSFEIVESIMSLSDAASQYIYCIYDVTFSDIFPKYIISLP